MLMKLQSSISLQKKSSSQLAKSKMLRLRKAIDLNIYPTTDEDLEEVSKRLLPQLQQIDEKSNDWYKEEDEEFAELRRQTDKFKFDKPFDFDKYDQLNKCKKIQRKLLLNNNGRNKSMVM